MHAEAGSDPKPLPTKEEFSRALAGKSARPGKPAVVTYWLLRDHGKELVSAAAMGEGLRSMLATIAVGYDMFTLHAALKSLDQDKIYEAVAKDQWAELEDLLFAKRFGPSFRCLPFYLNHIKGHSSRPNTRKLKQKKTDQKTSKKARPHPDQMTPPVSGEGAGETPASPNDRQPLNQPSTLQQAPLNPFLGKLAQVTAERNKLAMKHSQPTQTVP